MEILALLLGMLIGSPIGWLLRHWWDTRGLSLSDAALVVSFLAEHGASSAHRIEMDMDDFTHGRVDWSLRNTKQTLRLLERLIAEGTIERRLHYSSYEYALVAPRERMMRVS